MTLSWRLGQTVWIGGDVLNSDALFWVLLVPWLEGASSEPSLSKAFVSMHFARGPELGKAKWGFPKIGDPNKVPCVVGSLL